MQCGGKKRHTERQLSTHLVTNPTAFLSTSVLGSVLLVHAWCGVVVCGVVCVRLSRGIFTRDSCVCSRARSRGRYRLGHHGRVSRHTRSQRRSEEDAPGARSLWTRSVDMPGSHRRSEEYSREALVFADSQGTLQGLGHNGLGW